MEEITRCRIDARQAGDPLPPVDGDETAGWTTHPATRVRPCDSGQFDQFPNDPSEWAGASLDASRDRPVRASVDSRRSHGVGSRRTTSSRCPSAGSCLLAGDSHGPGDSDQQWRAQHHTIAAVTESRLEVRAGACGTRGHAAQRATFDTGTRGQFAGSSGSFSTALPPTHAAPDLIRGPLVRGHAATGVSSCGQEDQSCVRISRSSARALAIVCSSSSASSHSRSG